MAFFEFDPEGSITAVGPEAIHIADVEELEVAEVHEDLTHYASDLGYLATRSA